MTVSRRQFLKGVVGLTGVVALAPYGKMLPMAPVPTAPFVPEPWDDLPKRLTVPSGLGGVYLVSTTVHFNAAGDGKRVWAAIAHNDQPVGVSLMEPVVGGMSTMLQDSRVLNLEAGDTVSVVTARGVREGRWSAIRLT